jgi:hypothetical protein
VHYWSLKHPKHSIYAVGDPPGGLYGLWCGGLGVSRLLWGWAWPNSWHSSRKANLRLKGTFAQAELHIIRARLHGGKLNKASKGELRFALPVGFVFEGDRNGALPLAELAEQIRTAGREVSSAEALRYSPV